MKGQPQKSPKTRKMVKKATEKESGMKYLIMEDFSGRPVTFVFPRRVDHGDMRDQLPYGRVLGAGYVDLREGKFHCYGGSAELDIVARPEDEAILAEAFEPKDQD